MSSPIAKKATKHTSKGFLGANFGSVGKFLDPAGAAISKMQKTVANGGSVTELWKSGEITDPGHLLHSTPSGPVEAPPTATAGEPEGRIARDRIRRQAYRAQGRRSTIRSNQFGGYSGTPAQLLGS